eukprot:ctg_698.g335
MAAPRVPCASHRLAHQPHRCRRGERAEPATEPSGVAARAASGVASAGEHSRRSRRPGALHLSRQRQPRAIGRCRRKRNDISLENTIGNGQRATGRLTAPRSPPPAGTPCVPRSTRDTLPHRAAQRTRLAPVSSPDTRSTSSS